MFDRDKFTFIAHTHTQTHTYWSANKEMKENWNEKKKKRDKIFSGFACSHSNTTSHTYHVEKNTS